MYVSLICNNCLNFQSTFLICRGQHSMTSSDIIFSLLYGIICDIFCSKQNQSVTSFYFHILIFSAFLHIFCLFFMYLFSPSPSSPMSTHCNSTQISQKQTLTLLVINKISCTRSDQCSTSVTVD